MSFGLLKNVTPPIAVDFGVSALKVLQIQPGNPPTLIAAGMVETPPNLLAKPQDRLAFQAQALPGLLRRGDYRGKRAVCSVSAQATFVQHLRVQPIPGTPVKHLLAEQIQQHTDRDISQFILRHIEVAELNRYGAKMVELLCIAMPRDAVMHHMKAIRSAKLEPVGVHTEHVALVRSLDHIQRRAADRELTTMLVDIGYGSTKVAVSHGREPIMAKTLQVGGLQFDKAAARMYGVSFKEARQRRVAHVAELMNPARVGETVAAGAHDAPATLPPDVEPASPHDDPEADTPDRRQGSGPSNLASLEDQAAPTAEAGATASDLMEAFADEVSLSVRYHQALFSDRPIARLVFTGGEASRTDLCNKIADAAKVSGQIADPLTILKRPSGLVCHGVDLDQPAPGWAVALGLCNAPTDL